jgi:hypothetical protein
MARFDYVQTNFTRGELSPRLQGRIDFQGFFNGVEELNNMIVIPHGGVMKRPGTQFVAETKQDNPTRLLPFEFSVEETYVLEMGGGYMRFFVNEGQLFTNGVSGASITNGTFDSDISGWDDDSQGAANIGHTSRGNGRLALNAGGSDHAIAHQDISITDTDTVHTIAFRIENATDSKRFLTRVKVGSSRGANDLYDNNLAPGWHVIDVDPQGTNTMHLAFETTDNQQGLIDIDDVEILDGVPVEIGTPWDDTEIFALKWVQSADIMWVCHPDHGPYQLKRFSPTEFSLVKFPYMNGPYRDVNQTPTTLTPSVSSTNARGTLTASSTVGINDGNGFLATDVGRLVRLKQSGTWGWAEIVDVNSSTEVDIVVGGDGFNNTNATADWRLGEWSGTTGWPQVVTFHDQRLVFGATDTNPQNIWFSAVADFDLFQPSARDGTVSNDDAINITISASQVNAIRWMESLNAGLAVGTSGAEFLIRAATTTDPLSPNSIEAERNTNRGSADIVPPAKIGHSLMFVQRGNRVIRELAFDFDIDGLRARDFSVVSEHLLRPRIVRLAYQQNRNSILWALRNDARLIGFTIESDQEVFAWHQHTIGGTFNGGDAFIESITNVTEGNLDQIWMVVRRDVNGTPVRYVEFMQEPWLNDEKPIEDAFFVDSGLTYDGSPTQTITGLDHLEGETVDVLADGAAHPQRVVSNGQIDLDFEASVVHVGFPYSAGLRTFPFNTGVEADTLSGKIKRIHKLHIFFYETVGAKYGYNASDLDTLQFRDSSMAMDQPVPPFTGFKDVNFPMSHDLDAHIVVRSTQPLPMTILQVAASMEFYRDAGGQQ